MQWRNLYLLDGLYSWHQGLFARKYVKDFEYLTFLTFTSTNLWKPNSLLMTLYGQHSIILEYITTVFPQIASAESILFWIFKLLKTSNIWLLQKLCPYAWTSLHKEVHVLCNENLNNFLTRLRKSFKIEKYSREETIRGNTVNIYHLEIKTFGLGSRIGNGFGKIIWQFLNKKNIISNWFC